MENGEKMPMMIRCRDCHEEFLFTAGEQEFYAEKEFTPPKRCAKCRRARKKRNFTNHERGQ